MRLAQLEYFLAVAERLNFTSAAKALYISQPALSKQIALLEEELGARLFIRNSRKVLLTAAGEQFKRDLTAIRQDLNDAIRRTGKIAKADQRTVRVGCFDGKINQDFLPTFYQHIQKIDPDIRISLQMGVFEEIKVALDQGEIDIMLTLDKAFHPDAGYSVRRIAKRTGALVYHQSLLSPDRPVQPDITAFQDAPLLLVSKPDAPIIYEQTLSDLKRAGIEPPKIIEVRNTTTLFTHLEMGCGYTIMFQDVVGSSPNLHALPLNLPYMETWVLAVWKKNHTVAELLMDGFGKRAQPL